MPGLDKHIQKSVERTGKEYRKVHEWIDEQDNKPERHDITRVLEFSKMFEEEYGAEAAQEYVHHLSDDLNTRFGHLVDDIKELIGKNLVYFGATKS